MTELERGAVLEYRGASGRGWVAWAVVGLLALVSAAGLLGETNPAWTDNAPTPTPTVVPRSPMPCYAGITAICPTCVPGLSEVLVRDHGDGTSTGYIHYRLVTAEDVQVTGTQKCMLSLTDADFAAMRVEPPPGMTIDVAFGAWRDGLMRWNEELP